MWPALRKTELTEVVIDSAAIVTEGRAFVSFECPAAPDPFADYVVAFEESGRRSGRQS
jgi:hypothetical protein